MEGRATFDVFISYNRADQSLVEPLAQRLCQEGVKPWLDQWCLTQGGNWQREISEGLRSSSACAVLVGPHGVGNWSRMELGAALDRVAKDREFRLFLVLLPGASMPEEPELDFLTNRNRVDLRTGLDHPGAVDDLLAAIRGLGGRRFEAATSPVAGPAGHNLPVALTNFVGREQQIADVRGLVQTTRLLTLTGPGGCGKTRLALEVASQLVGDFEHGVWFVELAPVSEPGLIAHQIAAALRLREESGRDLSATITDYVRPRQLLLVLDNCEHLIQKAVEMAALLLQAAPRIRILATSREALDVAGESVWPVPSLAIPDAASSEPVEVLAGYEAVRLFVARAKAALPSFALTSENAKAVAAICTQLDGIPLAIELAAARVRALSPAQIAAHMDDRFRLLTGGRRDVLPRQRTLRALVDWSYDLLSEAERALLRRLSLFAGGFTLEAAEEVCSGGVVDGGEVLDLVCELVDKSLVLAHAGETSCRYSMLETIRQYGAQRLAEQGEDGEIETRFRRWFLDLAERAEPELEGPAQARWLEALESEHDNLRQALQASAREGELDAVSRLAGAIWRFWWIRGYSGEGRAWLEDALTNEDLPPPLRAKALHTAGALAWDQADFRAARYFLGAAMALFTEVGDERGYASCLWKLGAVLSLQGDNAGARKLLEEGLALGRRKSDRYTMAVCLVVLGQVAMQEGRPDEARPYFDESLMGFEAEGDTWGVACCVGWLGEVALLQGNREQALPMLEKSLEMGRQLGDRWRIAWALATLGELARADDDLVRALTLHRTALQLRREIGQRDGVAESLEGLAAVAHDDGDDPLAARLVGAANALREMLGAPVHPVRLSAYQELLSAIRARLDEEAFDQAWASGQALSLEEAVELACGRSASVASAAA